MKDVPENMHALYKSYWDMLRCASFELTYARADSDAWLGHVGFAYLLVHETKPSCIVELGTHWGNSYFSFCQAVRETGCTTQCFSVDTWEGDEHAQFYANDVFDTVNAHNNAYYSDFSTLKRTLFDKARQDFEDNSIDVLHIDGFHSYASVRHDFETWFDAVKPGGFVLLHDVNEYQEGFGVHRFWDELCGQSQERHLFRHSHGLGVWRKPGGSPLQSSVLNALLCPDSPESTLIDAFCVAVSERTSYHHKYLLECKNLQEAHKTHDETMDTLSQERRQHSDLRCQHSDLRCQHSALLSQLEEHQSRIAQFEGNLAMERQFTQDMLHSKSWRITAPLRAVKPLCMPLVRTAKSFVRQSLKRVLLLPASWAVSKGFCSWIKNLITGKQFLTSLESDPGRIMDTTAHTSSPVRWLIRLPLLLVLLMNIYGLKRGIAGLVGALTGRDPDTAAELTEILRGDIANEKKTRRSIMVMDYLIPQKDHNAGDRATWGIILDFKTLGYDVTFMSPSMADEPVYRPQLEALGIKVLYSRNIFSNAAIHLGLYGRKYELFYLVRANVVEVMVGLIRQAAPASKIFFHAPDLAFLRLEREAISTGSSEILAECEYSRHMELTAVRNTDCTVAISKEERHVLHGYLPEANIALFQGLYAKMEEQVPAFQLRKDIFFLGNFGHRPNGDAVLWFVQEIWPLVHDKLPHVRFVIAGSNMPDNIKDLEQEPGVVAQGYVRELQPFLGAMRMGVAPLRFGAGIKGKVAMTMGAGVPSVCTLIAAEGMGIKDGIHARVADSAKDFANAVVDLYENEDLWNTLSQNGQKLVDQKFSETANRRKFIALLHDQHVLEPQLWADYCASLEPRPLPQLNEQPQVSIIIPVYNKWNLTKACLASIIETTTGKVSYEVILADDGSSDNTTRAGEIFPGVHTVRTPSNMGFLRNCNFAAKQATGKYLLLLNNDTVVFPHWLDALFTYLEENQDVGIAGSRLVYPDGHLQEAGGVLWNDASAINYGQGNFYNAPHCLIERDAHYISGASIMVRHSLWKELGGFDERYTEAYYEDTDLCMATRAQGLRVVYMPKSAVIHFEHQTYHENGAETQNKLMAMNRAKFFEKWCDTLERDFLPAGTCPHATVSHFWRFPPAVITKKLEEMSFNALVLCPITAQLHDFSALPPSLLAQIETMRQKGHSLRLVLLPEPSMTPEAQTICNSQKSIALWKSINILPLETILSDMEKPEYINVVGDTLCQSLLAVCGQNHIDTVLYPVTLPDALMRCVPAYVKRQAF